MKHKPSFYMTCAALAGLIAIGGAVVFAQGFTAKATAQPTPSANAAHPAPYNDFYYGWKGQPVRLHISDKTIGITFKRKVSRSQIRGFLRSHGLPGPPGEQAIAGPHLLHTVSVGLPPGLSRADIRRAINTLSASPDVESAHPVFRLQTEKESMLTDFFYVSFPLDMPEREILALFTQDGLEIISKSTFEFIGKVGYRVKVTEYAKQLTGEDALTMANRYHEYEI